MKLYDLKLKEIEVLERKIAEEKVNLRGPIVEKPTKANIEKQKDKKLQDKLQKQKHLVAQTVKEVVSHQNQLIVIIIYYIECYGCL